MDINKKLSLYEKYLRHKEDFEYEQEQTHLNKILERSFVELSPTELPFAKGKFEKGQLYKSIDHLFVYPTALIAAQAIKQERSGIGKGNAHGVPPGVIIGPKKAAEYWSNAVNCDVKYSNPCDLIMFLRLKNFRNPRNLTVFQTLEFLFPNFSGWVANNASCRIRPVCHYGADE